MSRVDKILEAIKELGPISAADLMEYAGYENSNTTSTAISRLRSKYPQICRDKNGYFWRETKNHEGYPDPTATTAINNIARSMMENGITTASAKKETVFFEIGRFIKLENDFRQGINKFLVIGKSGKYIYCLPVNNYVSKSTLETGNIIYLPDSYKIICDVIETIDIISTPISNITLGKDGIARVSNDILDKIKLKLPTFVNNDVKKDMVEKQPTKENVEFLLIKQRADIYEQVFYAMCKAFGGSR